mmetsp:Transcript_11546/g.26787  ORF Transcript_11546/g.26787 Transcript_11546/m.26787 type:complete len:680 (+) Transcript_11546:277-2316(+)
MQRIVSGDDIHGLPKNRPSSDLDLEEATTSLARNSIEGISTMMSHSPSVRFDEAGNFVENDLDGSMDACTPESTTMDVDNATGFTTGVSESINADLRLAQQTEQDNSNLPQGQNPTPQSLIPINQNESNRSGLTGEQHPQTPLSIISGLLPNVGLLPISRNDSRNSGTTTSFGSGLQRSQNSSRDWGWFEDVHHSDQSVTSTSVSGGGIGGTRSGGHTNNSGRTTTGGSATSAGTNKTSLPQHQLTGTRDEIVAHGGGLGTVNNGNGGGSGRGANSRLTNNDANENNHYPTDGGETANNDNNNRLRERGREKTKKKAASLLPTGDEMLIDEMQEYLEPILVHPRPRDMENEAAVQAVTAPNYVLEESLSDQLLWKETAGNRPPQPVEERAWFEAEWAKNFLKSEVEYRMPAEVLTATTPVSLNPFADGNFGNGGTGAIGAGGTPVADVGGSHSSGGNHKDIAEFVSSFVVPGGTSGHGVASDHQIPHHTKQNRIVRSNSLSGGNLIVYAKGDNVFGTTVSKSFARPSINGELVSGVDTVNISIASYRVVESKKRGKHAQFLVIYREGGIRDTIGVWKRYSDFQELSKKVTNVHEGCASVASVIANVSPFAITEEHDVEHLPNAITSWHLLKKRKRWYRCLDTGYLSLKAFLLERFLHDILFESSTPELLRDFVGVPALR